MSEEKKCIDCCFNCYNVRADKILAGLEEGELPCKHYPPHLPIGKDIMQVYVCEHYQKPKINQFKVAVKKRKQRKAMPSNVPKGIRVGPNAWIFPINKKEDVTSFFKKLFGLE